MHPLESKRSNAVQKTVVIASGATQAALNAACTLAGFKRKPEQVGRANSEEATKQSKSRPRAARAACQARSLHFPVLEKERPAQQLTRRHVQISRALEFLPRCIANLNVEENVRKMENPRGIYVVQDGWVSEENCISQAVPNRDVAFQYVVIDAGLQKSTDHDRPRHDASKHDGESFESLRDTFFTSLSRSRFSRGPEEDMKSAERAAMSFHDDVPQDFRPQIVGKGSSVLVFGMSKDDQAYMYNIDGGDLVTYDGEEWLVQAIVKLSAGWVVKMTRGSHSHSVVEVKVPVGNIDLISTF